MFSLFLTLISFHFIEDVHSRFSLERESKLKRENFFSYASARNGEKSRENSDQSLAVLLEILPFFTTKGRKRRREEEKGERIKERKRRGQEKEIKERE